MKNRGMAGFTAFCLAAGMTFGGNGIVSLAAGTEVALVGVGSTTKVAEPDDAAENETEASEEAPVEDGEAENSEEDSTEAARIEAAVETEAETEAPLDTSMVDTIGIAQCEEYINIRSLADRENGEVLGKLSNNAAVYIESVDENGWYKVKSGNVEGYVASQYITTGAAAETLASEVGYQVASVGAEVLNVRASADEGSDIVTTVTDTQEVEIVEDLGDWLKVAVDSDCYGYVSADYVQAETQYKVAESVEEEQARLDAEYQAYLDQQAAAEAEYQAYLDQQAADAEYQAQIDAAYQVQLEADAAAQAQADAAYQAQLEADAAAQQTADAQAQAEAEYQAYLDAQAQADAAQQQADEQAALDAAAQAQAEYQAYLEAQAAADAQAQAEADAAAQAQAEADAAAQAQAAADAQAQAEADSYTEDTYSEDSYTEDTYSEDTSYTEDTSSSYGQQIANFACQFVGNPYVWGGTSLTGGADCSGFTQSVMANFGIYIPRTAAEQSGSGTPVDLGSIQPGDLLFYSGGSGIGHVTMYIGNGQVVHASNSSTGIIISSYSYRSPVSARRYW